MLNIQNITDNAVASLIANSQLYSSYRQIGRDTKVIEVNIKLLYLCLKAIPYMETTDNNDINRAQGIIMQTM